MLNSETSRRPARNSSRENRPAINKEALCDISEAARPVRSLDSSDIRSADADQALGRIRRVLTSNITECTQCVSLIAPVRGSKGFPRAVNATNSHPA